MPRKAPSRQYTSRALRATDEDARERLLAAGEALFAERPFDAVSIDDISAAAGVAHGLLFFYFKNKREFLLAVTRRAAERIDLAHANVPPQETPEKSIRAFLQCHLDSVSHRKASFLAQSRGGAGIDADVKAIWEASRANAIQLVYGYLQIKDPPAKLFPLMRAWLGFFDELIVFWLQRQDVSGKQVIDVSVANLRSTLASYRLFDPAGALKIGRPL